MNGECLARPLTRLPSRQDRSDFARFVAALPPSNFRLGLTHVTTGYFLRDILEARKIVASADCPVLKKPLVYAFYGRPAYRGRTDDVPSDLPFLFPAVLILDPQAAPSPKHVFGFDSGAFMAGLMDDYLDPHMPLFDFYLEPHVGSAARLAQAFFGTPRDFLNNNPASTVEVPAGNYEAFSFSKMVASSGRGANKLDDRVSTPELIFDEIPIEGCVRAAILPDALAGDPTVGGRIETLGIDVHEYEWCSASRPLEYHRIIRKIAFGIYEGLGWL